MTEELRARADMAEHERWQQHRAAPGGVPLRGFPTSFEVRHSSLPGGGKATIVGYASTTGPDNAYSMHDQFGEYTEELSPGAFAKTLSEAPRVQLLLNHAGLSMAYTRSGSLALSEDSAGLHYEATVNTARSDVRDMVLCLEDGDAAESSFGFRVVKQSWSPDFDYRKITEVNLDRGDVSVVNFGANPNTPVQVERAQRIVAQLREGRALDAADVNMLSQALGWFTAVDSIVDDAQSQLAAYLGVEDPDDVADELEAELEAPADPAAARAAMQMLRVRFGETA